MAAKSARRSGEVSALWVTSSGIIVIVMSAEDGEITICPLGPLTNVGLALVREPRIAERLREIVLMGGGFFEGGGGDISQK